MKTTLFESILESPGFLAASMAAVPESEGRRRDVVFYSGAKVERFDWWTGEMYDLSFDMDGADLSALRGGAPVLNGHSSASASDVIGVIEGANKRSGKYVAALRFSDRPEVDGIWQDIEDGILNAVSMGVGIKKLILVEDDKKAKRKHYMASEWKPFEVSVVPIGADPGARFLSMDPRLERMRAINDISATGAASNADESDKKARLALAIKQRRFRVLGR
jgi:hypothetical protein